MSPATGASRRLESSDKAVKRMPSMGIRKVSLQWEGSNPFQVFPPANTNTEIGMTPEKYIHILPHQTHDGSAKAGDNGGDDMVGFAHVALADTSAPKTEGGGIPTSCDKSSASAACIRGVPSYSASMSLQASDPVGSSSTSPSDGASLPVVVARAECELAHPRPSRSSESRMLKVLVKGKGDADERGDENENSPQRQGHISQESSTSFHTAQTA